MKYSKIGWALIGASTIAKDVVGPILAKRYDSDIKGVFSSSFERGIQYAKECGLPIAYRLLDNVLNDEEVQAVYISTTNDLHKDMVIAAARAGKHILCEKPLSTSIEAAVEMVREAKQAGVILAVLHHQPALPQYRLLHKLISEGAIGKPLSMRICHTIKLPPQHIGSWRIKNPEKGAGVFFDLTSHDVDMTRFMLDDEIDEIFACSAAGGLIEQNTPEVADNTMGIMRTKKGITVAFHDSYTISNTNGCSVLGTEGVLTANELGPYSAVPAKEVTLLRSNIQAGKFDESEMQRIPVEDQVNPFERSIESFHAAVCGEGNVIRDGRDGAYGTAAIITAIKSSISGKMEKLPQLSF